MATRRISGWLGLALALTLLNFSAAAASDDDTLSAAKIQACKESSACRAYVGVTDWTANAGAIVDDYKKKILDFYNAPSRQKALTQEEYLGQPIDVRQPKIDACIKNNGQHYADRCRENNMTPQEYAAWQRETNPVKPMGEDAAKWSANDIRDRDAKLAGEIKENCGERINANHNSDVCHKLVERLNGLENEAGLLNKDQGFLKFQKVVSLTSSAAAGKARFPQDARGKWDENYVNDIVFPLPPTAAPGAPTVVSAVQGDMAMPDTSACDAELSAAYLREPGKGGDVVAQVKANVTSKGYLDADESTLEEGIAAIEQHPRSDHFLQIHDRYAACLYRAQLKQLRARRGGALRRGGSSASNDSGGQQASTLAEGLFKQSIGEAENDPQASARLAAQGNDRASEIGGLTDHAQQRSRAIMSAALGGIADQVAASASANSGSSLGQSGAAPSGCIGATESCQFLRGERSCPFSTAAQCAELLRSMQAANPSYPSPSRASSNGGYGDLGPMR